jgi:hypothetical protein
MFLPSLISRGIFTLFLLDVDQDIILVQEPLRIGDRMKRFSSDVASSEVSIEAVGITR